MEIESKFRVANRVQFEQLCSLEMVAGYAVKEPATKIIADHYLDTASGSVQRGGFALRLRHNTVKGTWVATVKGLGQADGAVHSRAEYETPIPPDTPPQQWPESPARTLALELIDGQPLRPLFTIEQTRHTRQVMRGGRLAGELSLDAVTYHAGTQRREGFELEIELGDAGSVADLETLNAALLQLGLAPEPRSKFERGLELLSV